MGFNPKTGQTIAAIKTRFTASELVQNQGIDSPYPQFLRYTEARKGRKAMDDQAIIRERALRYYLRLNYPVRTLMNQNTCIAVHPDLPGCEVRGQNPRDAFVKLEKLRQRWIYNAISLSLPVPSPNDYIEGPSTYQIAPHLLGNSDDES